MGSVWWIGEFLAAMYSKITQGIWYPQMDYDQSLLDFELLDRLHLVKPGSNYIEAEIMRSNRLRHWVTLTVWISKVLSPCHTSRSFHCTSTHQSRFNTWADILTPWGFPLCIKCHSCQFFSFNHWITSCRSISIFLFHMCSKQAIPQPTCWRHTDMFH